MAGGAQDISQNPTERSELSQLSCREAVVSKDTCELGSGRLVTFDLLNMVVSYKKIGIYVEPLREVAEVVQYLLGWKTPLISLFCCVMLNILFVCLSDVAWFSLCLMFVSMPALLGYIGERCQVVTTDTEMKRKQHHAVHRGDLQTVFMTKQEAMVEVKGLLKQLDDLLSQACVSAEQVYKVLYWESHSVSSMFYGGLLTSVCLLYAAPLGWVLALFNSALFLWNTEFARVLMDVKAMVSSSKCQSKSDKEVERGEVEATSIAEQTPTPTCLEDLSPGSIEQAEEAEPDDEFKDAIESSLFTISLPKERHLSLLTDSTMSLDDDDMPLGIPDYDAISDSGLLSRNEPIRSKVSKLTEKLRKRYPTNPTGNCSSCNAVFSVLKKRKNCSNCGNSFCSRCCSYKVFKSTMGATAPEAQRETVFVCAACNVFLSK